MPALDNRQWLNENKQLGTAMPTRQPGLNVPSLGRTAAPRSPELLGRATAPVAPTNMNQSFLQGGQTPAGLGAMDRQRPEQSRYSAKKEKLEAFEETKPEVSIAEMIVDSFIDRKFGFKPYAYGASQAEKDIQKQRAGVDVERQKVTKKAMGVMHQVADHSSQYYGDLPHMAKQLNKNPEIWGKIDNIKTTGKIPPLDSQGNQNEFAGMPLYTFNRTDPDTGETETMTASVPEMIQNYHAGLSPADQVAAERVVLRTQKQKELEAQIEAQGLTLSKTWRGKDRATGRPIYEARRKNGEVFFTYGVPNENGQLEPIPSNVQVDVVTKPMTEYQKGSLGVQKGRLALDWEKARKDKDTSGLTKSDRKDIYNAGKDYRKAAKDSDEYMGIESPSERRSFLKNAQKIGEFGLKSSLLGRKRMVWEGQEVWVEGDKDGKVIGMWGESGERVSFGKQTGTGKGKPQKGKRPKGRQPSTAKTTGMKERKQYPKSKYFDAENKLIKTEGFKKAVDLARKTGDYAGAAQLGVLRGLTKVGDLTVEGVASLIKKAVESQKQAQKQSFGR